MVPETPPENIGVVRIVNVYAAPHVITCVSCASLLHSRDVGDVWILMGRTVGGAVLILNSDQLIATQLIRVGIGVPLLSGAGRISRACVMIVSNARSAS